MNNKPDQSRAKRTGRSGVMGFVLGIFVFIGIYALTNDRMESINPFFTQLMIVSCVVSGTVTGMFAGFYQHKI